MPAWWCRAGIWVVEHGEGPSVASGERVPVLVGPGWPVGSGRGGQLADAREDLGEQVVAGWQAQDERAGVADQPGRDAAEALDAVKVVNDDPIMPPYTRGGVRSQARALDTP